MENEITEIINKFPDGVHYYQTSALFNSLVKFMWQGMTVEEALIECIKFIDKQDEKMQEILINAPQRVILTRMSKEQL